MLAGLECWDTLCGALWIIYPLFAGNPPFWVKSEYSICLAAFQLGSENDNFCSVMHQEAPQCHHVISTPLTRPIIIPTNNVPKAKKLLCVTSVIRKSDEPIHFWGLNAAAPCSSRQQWAARIQFAYEGIGYVSVSSFHPMMPAVIVMIWARSPFLLCRRFVVLHRVMSCCCGVKPNMVRRRSSFNALNFKSDEAF